jgi:hypothetical protein
MQSFGTQNFESNRDEMNEMNEYSAFIEQTDVRFPTTTIERNLGGKIYFSKLLTWIQTYNKYEETTSLEAKEINARIDVQKFGFRYCYESKELFWSFLKTFKPFMIAPWYYRDYVVEKILREIVSINDIL